MKFTQAAQQAAQRAQRPTVKTLQPYSAKDRLKGFALVGVGLAWAALMYWASFISNFVGPGIVFGWLGAFGACFQGGVVLVTGLSFQEIKYGWRTISVIRLLLALVVFIVVSMLFWTIFGYGLQQRHAGQ